MKPVIINLWAPPGVGKSRTAAGLFHLMKHAGYRVEHTYEFAKRLTYEGKAADLKRPMYVTVNQEYLHECLIGHVDYIISDSPTGMSIAYTEDGGEAVMVAVYARHVRPRYRCLDIELQRTNRPYETYGRSQTLEESRALEERVRHAILMVQEPGWYIAPADENAAKHILNLVERRYGRD
jgi:hypothetical protein